MVLLPLATPGVQTSEASASAGPSGPEHVNPNESAPQPTMDVSTVQSLQYCPYGAQQKSVIPAAPSVPSLHTRFVSP